MGKKKNVCWVLGGKGLIGSSFQKLCPDNQIYDFKFLGRQEYTLDTATHPGFEKNDIVIDLIPSSRPLNNATFSKEDYHKIFTTPHLALIEIAKNAEISKYIFISSGGAIYGKTDALKLNEEDPLNPISYYGESKLQLEKAIQSSGLPYVILRPSNVFDPNPRSRKNNGIVGAIINCLYTDSPLNIFGNLEIKKDYISSEDVAQAILQATHYPKSGTFNIGSGVATSIGEIIKSFESATKRKISIQYHSLNPLDVPYFCLDTSQAKSLLKFNCTTIITDWILNSFNPNFKEDN